MSISAITGHTSRESSKHFHDIQNKTMQSNDEIIFLFSSFLPDKIQFNGLIALIKKKNYKYKFDSIKRKYTQWKTTHQSLNNQLSTDESTAPPSRKARKTLSKNDLPPPNSIS